MRNFLLSLVQNVIIYHALFYTGFVFGQWYVTMDAQQLTAGGVVNVWSMAVPWKMLGRGIDAYFLGAILGLTFVALAASITEEVLKRKESLPGVPTQ
jgi:hypothetical protein